jgi:hypothetical protein
MVDHENSPESDPNLPENASRTTRVGQPESGRSDLVTEVRRLTESGTKTSTLLFSAALIWWITNLFPFNFSERITIGTPTSRLGELTQKAESASITCNEAFHDFAMNLYLHVSTRSNGVMVTCFAPETLSKFRGKTFNEIAETSRTTNWAQNIRDTELDLAELAKVPGCQATIEEWRNNKLSKCIANRKEVLDFVADLSKQGNLDLLGLKISNIHPKWHPIVLVGLLASWAIWLGAYRRRIFALLHRHFSSSAAKRESAGDDSAGLDPVFLSPSWWLWPTPRWKYSDGRRFSELFAPAAEYRRLRLTTFIMVVITGAMFVSAVEEQTRVSALKRMTALGQALAELPRPSFALMENVSTDLFVLSFIFFGATAIFLWALPPKQRPRLNESGPSPSRREILVRGAIAAGFVSLASMTVAGSVDPRGSRKYLGSVPHRIGLPGRPRFQRQKQIAVHPGPPGWYRNVRSATGDNREGAVHFVKPAMYVERRIRGRGWRGLFARVAAGRPEKKYKPARIGGAGNIDVTKLRKLADDELLKQERNLNPHYYSEGIEVVALDKWRAKDRKGAIEILKVVLGHARNQPRVNIRLYDLYAGLLVRSGGERGEEFNSLLADIEKFLGMLGEENERNRVLRERLERWREASGKWRKSWQAPAREWNGLDV